MVPEYGACTNVSQAMGNIGAGTEFSNASDARVTRLFLSAKGRAIYDEIVPLALAFERQFLEALSAEERVAFDRLLEKLAGEAKKLRG